MFLASVSLQSESTLGVLSKGPVINDSKALYDAFGNVSVARIDGCEEDHSNCCKSISLFLKRQAVFHLEKLLHFTVTDPALFSS